MLTTPPIKQKSILSQLSTLVYMALVTGYSAAPTVQNPDSSAVTHKIIVKSKESKTAKLHVYFSSFAAVCRDVIK